MDLPPRRTCCVGWLVFRYKCFFLIFCPGLLLLYTLCLKAAENDWTVGERTPPGPLHLPLIGVGDGRYDEDPDEDGMCSNDQ